MSASLANENAFNGFLAAGAGQAGSPEHAQLRAVVPPAAGNREKIAFAGSQGCAQVAQSAFENTLNSGKEFFAFSGRKSAGFSAGVQFGIPKGFINIDIAESGNKVLVKQQRFQHARTFFQHELEPLKGKIGFKRFRPKITRYLFSLFTQVQPGEFARIVQAQFASIGKSDAYMFVFVAVFLRLSYAEPARHAQVNEQCSVFRAQMKDNVLGTAIYILYPETFEFSCKGVR